MSQGTYLVTHFANKMSHQIRPLTHVPAKICYNEFMSSQKKQFPWKVFVLALAAVIAVGWIWYAAVRSAQHTPVPGQNASSSSEVAEAGTPTNPENADPDSSSSASSTSENDASSAAVNEASPAAESESSPTENPSDASEESVPEDHSVLLPSGIRIDLAEIPPYDGEANVELNGNIPFFTEEDFTTESFETYGDLDELGRCTYAFACVGTDLMPTEKRERISEIRPTGWQITKYDGIDGNFLYNRCHLIAYGLTAEMPTNATSSPVPAT